MDSRLIAGAYSQHYRALEQEDKEPDERTDSLARAKKLSQETNKRRKIQAQKRKNEAKREEQRRQEILTKRREEQKQATEKYQRSHVPVGQRQNSGRLSPQRYVAPCLDDALQLIRRSPRRERPASGRDRSHSPINENDDPLKRSYFNKPRHHSARPSSGRSNHLLNPEARAELMDYSLKNLTSSKSLFEQQLEQQQSILLLKQQQSLREFSSAVQRELGTGQVENEGLPVDAENSGSVSGSCSSLDSLDKSGGDARNVSENGERNETNSKPVAEDANANNNPSTHQNSFYLNPYSTDNENGSNSISGQNSLPLNFDMTPSAIFETDNNVDCKDSAKQAPSYSAGVNGVTKEELLEHQSSNIIQGYNSPLKQLSGDSLEGSVSSGSNISLIKLNENNDSNKVLTDLVPTGSEVDRSNGPHQQEQNPFLMNNHDNYQAANEPRIKGENLTSHHNNLNQGAAGKTQTGESQSNQLGQTAIRNEPVVESYNPRYASAIGLSIWPGHQPSSTVSNPAVNTFSNSLSPTTPTTSNTNAVSPYGKRTSSVVIDPSPSNPTQEEKSMAINSVQQNVQTGNHNQNQSMYTVQGMSLSSALPVNHPAGMNTRPFVPEMDNAMLHSFKNQDFVYPLSQNPMANPNLPQNHTLLPTHTSTYNNLQQEIKQLSDQMLENHHRMTLTSTQPSLPVQNVQYTSPSQPTLSSTTTTTAPAPSSSILTQPMADKVQVIHHIPHGNDFLSGPVPVPAVRTVFPANKPPVPKMPPGLQSQGSNPQLDRVKVTPSTEDSNKPSKTEGGDGGGGEEDLEMTKALKGILKPLPPKVPPQGHQKGAVQVRDSIELAKMQTDKKVKKKSVRWAAFLEETEDDYNSDNKPNAHNVGTSHYKQTASRPTSAKVVSQSALTTKPVRAASAGPTRQVPQTTPLPQTTSANNNHVQPSPKSNLPPNYSHPLNTTAPINRPKAAAHIIMSSEYNTHTHKDGGGINSPTSAAASSLHKSHLEVKVKAVNNNFMSKVPVKVNTATTAEVYQVSNPAYTSMAPGDHNLQHRDTQIQQNGERSRIRDNTPSKRVPLSNSTVTRTSIVPASTKINYPLPNGSAPSYSAMVSNGNIAQGQGHAQGPPSSATFDESKIRVDKTPTDEEINWLWDKVRNCLDKEGENNKQPTSAGNDQSARQTPILSTKIIDGNSLGLNTNGAPALRPGSGYFYTRNNAGGASNANGQNKIKPAVQQPGSYLRRYGLLQQRRVHSATGTPSNALAIQARAGSAGLGRYPATQQQQAPPMDGPKPIAFSYKPSDNVSESTAGFIMAERMANQSLTDSHIAAGMEDAQSKQEVYNRARLPAKPPAGPSALSMEEQRLMESLDRLNERLNAPEQKAYTGTIHYHQPYQPHLPGFRGHQGYTTGQRHHHPPASPRGQHRSQSARIRQQIRQYR